MADGQGQLIWRKSRFCANQACVEVARDDLVFLIRDSTDPDGARLEFENADWSAFIAALHSDDSGLDGVKR